MRGHMGNSIDLQRLPAHARVIANDDVWMDGW